MKLNKRNNLLQCAQYRIVSPSNGTASENTNCSWKSDGVGRPIAADHIHCLLLW